MIKHHILIIGYGSIGKRHAQLLNQAGYSVSLVTQQKIPQYLCFSTIDDAFLEKKFHCVIIANATDLHGKTLQHVLTKQPDQILIEKPLFSSSANMSEILCEKIYVGYNLRFHPVLCRIKQLLNKEKIISFSVYVGQYLPTWREQNDYRKSYSAKKSLGGGVLRDLSHELDYSTWICGDCLEVVALGGKYSDLEIETEDTYSILMRCDYCPCVMIHMDYLSRIKQRKIMIQTKKHTYCADLIKNTLSVDGREEVYESVDTYKKEHTAILNNDTAQLCSYEQGKKIVHLIETIETANQRKMWVAT